MRRGWLGGDWGRSKIDGKFGFGEPPNVGGQPAGVHPASERPGTKVNHADSPSPKLKRTPTTACCF